MMTEDELAGLIADIKEHGQQEPIVVFEDQILDGRNRYVACKKIGIEPKTIPYDGSDPMGFIISANLYRRHLTQAQKQEVVEKLLAASPERSDRAIGKLAHVDHKTVGARRGELESRGEIPRIERREDSKGRSYAAHRERGPETSSAVTAKHDRIARVAERRTAKHAAAVRAFLGVLREGDINRHLNELLKMLADEKHRIAALPKIQRDALARGFLSVLDIVGDELVPIPDVPMIRWTH